MGQNFGIGDFDFGKKQAQKVKVKELTERVINSLFVGDTDAARKRTQLLNMYLSGEISFGKDGLTEEEGKNFTSEIYENILKEYNKYKAKKAENKSSVTNYVVQPGDTPEKIAKALLGDNASQAEVDKLAREIKQNAPKNFDANGKQSKWLMVGEIIPIDGDYHQAIENLKNKQEYHAEKESLDNEYHKAQGKKAHVKTVSEEGASSATTTGKVSAKPKEDTETRVPTKEERLRYNKLSNQADSVAANIKVRREKDVYKRTDDGKVKFEGNLTSAQMKEYELSKAITKDNAAFIFNSYFQQTKHSLIQDVAINVSVTKKNGKVEERVVSDFEKDKAELNGGKVVGLKRKISLNLRVKLDSTLLARAKELGIPFDEDKIYDIEDVNEFTKFIEDISNKIMAKEKEIIQTPKPAKPVLKYTQVDIDKIEKNSKAIVEDIYKNIHLEDFKGFSFKTVSDWLSNATDNKNNAKTIEALKQIKPENVAFIVLQYAKKTKNGIVRDMINENGLTTEHVKQYICSKMVEQAQKLGLKDIKEADYKDLNHPYDLTLWLERASKQIAEAMGKSDIDDVRNVSEAELGQTALVPAEKDDIGETDTKKVTQKKLTKEQQEAGYTRAEEYRDLDGNLLYTLYYKTNAKGKEICEKEVNCAITTITKDPLFEKAGITKAEEVTDLNGKELYKLYYYNDGRIVKTYKKANKDGVLKTHRELLAGEASFFKTEHKIEKALPIDIELNLPDDIKNNPEALRNATAFRNTLVNEKADIMSKIANTEIEIVERDKNGNPIKDENGNVITRKYKVEIDNDLYDLYANLALSLAEHETQFGTNCRAGNTRNMKYLAVKQDSENKKNDSVNEATAIFLNPISLLSVGLKGLELAKGSSFSLGYTQIKYDDHMKMEDVSAIFKELGINYENIFEPEVSAKATVALLAILDTRMRYDSKVHSAISAAQGAIVEYNGYEMQNEQSGAHKTYNTEAWVNNLSHADVLCYAWNQPSALMRGDAEAGANVYVKNMRRCMEHYKVLDKNNARKEYLTEQYDNVASMRNLGGIGAVQFGVETEDAKYGVRPHMSTLNRKLSKTVPDNVKNELSQLVENGFIEFLPDDKKQRCNTITEKEANLLIKYSKKLREAKDPKEIKAIKDAFKQECSLIEPKTNIANFAIFVQPDNIKAYGSKAQYETLQKNLSSSIPDEIRNELLDLVQKKEISFRFGLSATEAQSITKQDAQLLIDCAKMDNKNEAAARFKNEYLQSKSVKLEIDYARPEQTVSLVSNSTAPIKWKAGRGGAPDTGVRTSNGIVTYESRKWYLTDSNGEKSPVNFADFTPGEVYAMHAQKVALETNTVGNCFGTWRYAAIEAGIDAAMSSSTAQHIKDTGKYKATPGGRLQEFKYYQDKETFVNKSQKDEKGHEIYYCDFNTSKASIEWFENHKDMFDEVKWVNRGNGKVDQITTADLPNLPAGYIVVWVPGDDEKYKPQPGHIGTNGGTGTCYGGDETDNTAWSEIGAYAGNVTDYGKGEHGTFRIFKLSDKWKVDPESGRLFFAE